MSNQGIKQYGTYYISSIKNGSATYVNLSKQFANVHFVIPLYSSKYLYNNVKTENGERFFTNPYDIAGEWAAHNFAASVTGVASVLLGSMPDNPIRTILFDNIHMYHYRSVHLDLGPSIDDNKSGLVIAISKAFKKIYEKYTFYILNW